MIKPIKQKRCKSCKEMFTPSSSLVTVCGFHCALEFGKAAAKAKKVKQLRAIEKDNASQKKEFKENDLPWQHKQCKKVFNKLRRLEEFKWFADRGLQPTCISCGGELGGDEWCCGHFKTVGAQGGLRYDKVNTYLQHNVRCNSNLSGDIHGTNTTRGYLKGLEDRFGEEKAKEIIEYCETNNQSVKWSGSELQELRKQWNLEIRILEKQLL